MARPKRGKTAASKKSAPAKKTPDTTSQVKGKGNKWHVSDESSSDNDIRCPISPKQKPHKQKKHVNPEVHEDKERVTEPEHIEEEEGSGDELEEGNDEVHDDTLALLS